MRATIACRSWKILIYKTSSISTLHNEHPQLTSSTHSHHHHPYVQPQLRTFMSPVYFLQGYSYSSFHYPYRTITINLRVNTYVQALTLGSQCNVQRYGLRLYNPSRNVDDTYYSSRMPEYGDRPAIVRIPLAKVAIRLYLNLYTTSDGRPPSNIKIVIVSRCGRE